MTRRIASDDPAAHYDRVTRAWQMVLGDELHYGDFSESPGSLARATLQLTGRMARHAALEPGVHVLDIGCGIGTPAIYLAKNLGCRVTGISTSRVGVEIATQRAPEHGVDYRVRFLVADGMDTRLPDASFDRAWVMESSHLMDDKARLLAECGRVLRVGGRLVLCDVILYHRLGIHEVVQKAREFDLLRRVFGRAKMATLDEYTAWALAAGIIVETREDLTNATRPTFARWRENAEARRPEIVETIGADSWADLVRSCDVLRAFWDDGILGYGLVMGTRVQ